MSTTETGPAIEGDSAAIPTSPRLRLLSNPVLWITVAWAGMLGFFLFAVPVYQAPDENTHVDRILSALSAGFPEYDELRYRTETVASMSLVGLTAQPQPYVEADAPERPLPTFAELAGGPPTATVNQLAGHPPAYYALMGGARGVLTGMLPRDVWQFDRDVLLLRALNVLLLLGLPWILARTARILGMSPWQAWIAAALPLCIPQLAHIGAAVNNDNLLILATALATMFALDVWARGLRWVPTVGMAVATGVAVQTKIFGWAIAPLVLVACVAGLRSRPGDWPRAVIALSVVALSGWTYLRNLLLHGHPYPTLAPAGQPVATDGFTVDLPSFLAHWAGNTVQSFFGRFGWLWLPLPRVWVVLLGGVLVVAVVLAALRPARAGVRVALIPVAAIVVMYLFTSYSVHVSTGAYAAQQGRYLFPVIASLAVAVASAATGLGRRAGFAVLLVAAVGWVLAALTLLDGFWQGLGLAKLGSLVAWSPLGGLAVLFLAIAGGAFWLGTAMAARQFLTRPRAGQPAAP